MESLQQLLTERRQLLAIKRILDRNASFHTEEGYHYAHTLVKLTLVTLKIERLLEDKEKATSKGR